VEKNETKPASPAIPSAVDAELGRSGWVLIGATSRGACERWSSAQGLIEPVIFDRYDLTRNPRAFIQATRRNSTKRIAVHSVDWQRETMPQLYSAALLAAAHRQLWLVDERSGAIRRLAHRRLASGLAATPFQVLGALLKSAAEVFRACHSRPPTVIPRSRGGSVSDTVLAIWGSEPDATVGGSVTHISGILTAFRRAGLRVALITNTDPVPQLREAVDEFVITRLPSPGERLTPEMTALAANREIRRAAHSLVSWGNAPPRFVYQRHGPLRVAGLGLSRTHLRPLVLEWNGSEAWTFANWADQAKPFRRLTARSIDALERRVLVGSTLVASVSGQAKTMAINRGADPARVVSIPNAVDLEAIDRALDVPAPVPPEGDLIGWVGSFGAWHGADVLVRAIAHLPADTRVLMIGEGRERLACQDLARRLGVMEKVTWHGKAPHRKTVQLLATCDVLVSPHVPLAGGEPFFGSPTKVFEYMALRRPIVASRLGQIAEILEHERTALLVEPGDDVELASAIASLLADPERGRRLADAARKAVETDHTWDQRAAAILAALGPD
jgi:glycosyltransferase involved in cell wall biosynthesis